jgi:hypothetical protein
MTIKKQDELKASTPTHTDTTPSEFLEVPWIVCKIPSKPCAMNPLAHFGINLLAPGDKVALLADIIADKKNQ